MARKRWTVKQASLPAALTTVRPLQGAITDWVIFRDEFSAKEMSVNG